MFHATGNQFSAPLNYASRIVGVGFTPFANDLSFPAKVLIVADSSEPLIVADSVSRKYVDGDVLALDNVSLSVQRGEYVAIVGPSGSGKSTLLNVLGGLDHPTSGKVLFDGKEITSGSGLDQLRSQHIGYVFQSFYLLPTLTAIENIQLPMFETSLTATQRKQRAQELLQIVGLEHRSTHLPTQLSVGERQRVAIARSLANRPDVLLADEPTGNLDTATGEEILKLFASLHKDHDMTLVVITHSHDVAQRAQRVVEVRDGRICRDELAGTSSTTETDTVG